jgi:hypothetical protein
MMDKVTRNDFCPHCDLPLKCCYNCRFYDKDAYHQCAETQAEWVRYKEKANLCSYFTPRPIPQEVARPSEPKAGKGSRKRQEAAADNGESRNGQQKDKKRAAWDKLFKDE